MNLRSHATSRTVLRLVGESAGSQRPERPRRFDRARRGAESEQGLAQVRRENHAAALRFDLDPNDPRLVLAARTQAELQGAALPADRRRRLLGLAHRLGLRPFDANLVIAIVQDQARCGAAAEALPQRLRIVPRPDPADDARATGGGTRLTAVRWRAFAPVALGMLLAAAVLAGLLRWLNGG